jgi:AcrR family transcriptional regulator
MAEHVEVGAKVEKRWTRRKDARPAEIVAAALDCFAERGFAGTRLDDVASRAGVTKGTLYLYFPNKQELFKAVVRETLLPHLDRILGGAEGIPPDPRERIRQAVEVFSTKVLGTSLAVIPKLVLAEAGNFPEIARFYLDEVVHRGRAVLVGAIRRGVELGQFRAVDPDHAFYTLIAPLLFAALWQNSLGPYDDRPLDGAAMIRQHLEIVFRGLAPEAPAPAARAKTEVAMRREKAPSATREP